MAPKYQGSTHEQLQHALDLVKSRANIESMGQYHKDLVKWSRNVDKRYAWVVLAALWLMMAATLGPYRIYGLVFAKVTAEGIFTREEASWPVSMIFTVENIVGPFVSVIVYHISYRNSMLLGGILLSLGNMLAYLSDSIVVDTICIGAVQGVGFAFIFMPFMEIINNYFLRYRNAALGVALCGGTMSVLVWSPIFQWVLSAYSWRFAYFCLGCICALNILMVPLLKPNPRPQKPDNEKKANNFKNAKGSGWARVSARALSFQNSLRRQSTILISRPASGAHTLNRNDSIISVNPFASSAGLERKISRVISSGVQQQAQNNTLGAAVPPTSEPRVLQLKQQEQNQPPTPNKEVEYETMSLGEVAEETESHFKTSIIWTILKTPGFHVIWYLELIYFWVFSIYCLIQVDYGQDRGCSHEEAQNLLSFQSLGEIIGRMVLTVIVDMRFLSNRNTVVTVLIILTGLMLANTQLSGYYYIASLTTSISAFASLLYILLNGLLVDYLGERQVTIGYGMGSFIVGIMIIFRPQAVGFFRDTMGSYDPLMMCLSGACLFGALMCLVEPLITRCCNKSRAELSDQSDDIEA